MMRKLLYAVVLGFAVYFVFTHLEELEVILGVLREGDFRWMLAAIGAQFLWLLSIGAAFQSTYRLVGVREKLQRMVPLTTAANFLNVVAPSYGAGAVAVLIADGQNRGKPAAKVSTAAVLYLVYDYLGFMVILAIGLPILYLRGALDTILVAASLFTVTIGVSLLVLTYFGVQSAEKLGGALMWLTKFANRLLHPVLHRDLFQHETSETLARDISEGLRHIRRSPGRLLQPGILALTRKLLMMVILYLVSRAFRHPLPLDTLVASFTTSYLFTIASVTPSGVGFVEGAMTVYTAELGVPLATSAAISVAYRGITFWLTLLYGVLAIRWVGYKPKRASSQPEMTTPAPAKPLTTTQTAGHLPTPLSGSNPESEDPEPRPTTTNPRAQF